MQNFWRRYYPIERKPEGTPETHVMVTAYHMRGSESFHERKTGFILCAQSVIVNDDGTFSVIFDGRDRPYCRIFHAGLNTEKNRAEFLSEENIAEQMIRIYLHCRDFEIKIDRENFLPAKIDCL